MKKKFKVENNKTLQAGDTISTSEGNFKIYEIFESYVDYMRYLDKETRSITPSTIKLNGGMYAVGRFE